MSSALIIKKYAEAFFQTVQDKKVIDEVTEDIILLQDFLNENEILLYKLSSPAFDRNTRKSIAKKVFAGRINKYTLNFINILLKRNRQLLLSDILKEFQVLIDNYKNIIRARLVTARELNVDEQKKLDAFCQKKTGLKLKLKFSIDKSVIAGFILIYQDHILDYSVSAKIKQLKNNLLGLSVVN